MIFMRRALALTLAIALAGTLAACEKPAPIPPSGVLDTAGLFSPIQRDRIEQTIERLREEHGLYLVVRTDFGAPLADRPSVDFPGKEVMSVELYPAPKVADVRFHSSGGVLAGFASSWENRLRSRVAPVWRTPGRTGDILELWLRELAEHFGTTAARAGLLPDDSKPVPDPSPVLRETPREHYEIHEAPPGWYKETSPAAPQPSANVAYAAFLEIARRKNVRNDLELYTPRSRENFENYPMTEAQLAHVLKKYARAPYELVELEGRAVVHFPTLDGSYVPYFFESSDDGWRIDFYSSALAIALSVDSSWYFKTHDHPYMFAFSKHWVDERGYVIYGAGRR